MKLRTKLFIAFLTLILVPILVVYIGFSIFASFQLRTVYGYEADGLGLFSNNAVQLLSSMTDSSYATIRELAEDDPDTFSDETSLDELNQELRNSFAFLVVRTEDEYTYLGSDGIEDGLLDELPKYDDSDDAVETRYLAVGNDRYLLKQADFTNSSGQKGSVFLITALDMLPQVRAIFIQMALLLVLLMVLVGLLLSMWIYRTILRPLGKLQQATHEIKDGNLDFELDVTEQDEIGQLCQDFEEMRQRLKESSEEKVQYDMENKELISNISHDLKTPITAIKGYCEGIMDGVASSPEKMDKYIRTIYNKANDMDRLIDELTFYSKIDTNKIPYTFTKVDIGDYFSDCVDELSMELEQKNISLSYDNEVAEGTIIIADTEQLKRVVNNIVNNSVKYLDKEKGQLEIRLLDEGDFVHIEIEDNGKGISQKDLPLIFDRFYRADASRTHSQGGSGIGLSIVKKIIEDHGGKIWATSTEGEGTTMHFVLRKYQEVLE